MPDNKKERPTNIGMIISDLYTPNFFSTGSTNNAANPVNMEKIAKTTPNIAKSNSVALK